MADSKHDRSNTICSALVADDEIREEPGTLIAGQIGNLAPDINEGSRPAAFNLQQDTDKEGMKAIARYMTRVSLFGASVIARGSTGPQ